MHLAGGRGLVTSARPPAAAVPQEYRVADPGRDVLGVADVERQARPGQPGAQLPGPQEGRQAARTGQQVHGLSDDGLLQRLAGPRGGRPGRRPRTVWAAGSAAVPADLAVSALAVS